MLLRPLVLVALFASCSSSHAFPITILKTLPSNNTKKILGEWKNSSLVEGAPAGSVTAEFKADGSLVMSALGTQVLTAKYSLEFGDYVKFTEVMANVKQKDARVRITITDDNMTWVEEKASYQFERVKPKK